MPMSPLAGKPAPPSMLVNIPRLVTAYYTERPDPAVREQCVAFGTSGHRGSAFKKTFNETHILAISQAICWYRQQQHISGPLFLGMDTHALSEPAFATALEVLAANGVEVMVDRDAGYTPTPVVSHAILCYNRGRTTGLADGIVITPSHNPPDNGGFKYNTPNGGPADTDVTNWIEVLANDLMKAGIDNVNRVPYARALRAATTHRHDYLNTYVRDLGNVVDMEAISGGGVGKTVVSSAMIDRVTRKVGRRLYEVPVGFKWFVNGLRDGTLGFCGEESAGASFLRRDGTVWTTDKDGIIGALLAAEITVIAGRDPGALYVDLAREFGEPAYDRDGIVRRILARE